MLELGGGVWVHEEQETVAATAGRSRLGVGEGQDPGSAEIAEHQLLIQANER